jgi:hypothetical protein
MTELSFKSLKNKKWQELTQEEKLFLNEKYNIDETIDKRFGVAGKESKSTKQANDWRVEDLKKLRELDDATGLRRGTGEAVAKMKTFGDLAQGGLSKVFSGIIGKSGDILEEDSVLPKEDNKGSGNNLINSGSVIGAATESKASTKTKKTEGNGSWGSLLGAAIAGIGSSLASKDSMPYGDVGASTAVNTFNEMEKSRLAEEELQLKKDELALKDKLYASKLDGSGSDTETDSSEVSITGFEPKEAETMASKAWLKSKGIEATKENIELAKGYLTSGATSGKFYKSKGLGGFIPGYSEDELSETISLPAKTRVTAKEQSKQKVKGTY